MYFRRENNRLVTLDPMFEQFKIFIRTKPDADYKIIIGTDSMVFGERTRYITAVTLQRIGNGATVFYNRVIKKTVSMSARIMQEVNLTIEIANQVIIPKCLEEELYYPIEIHIDIGNKGKSNQLRSMALGYAKGCGFDEGVIKLKPEAFGAAKVADRYTR